MDSPVRSVLKKLEAKGLSLGSVESLTGGLFASTVCEVPGASKVFKGAIVTYANSVKEHLVDVMEETIQTYGVVSEQVAEEMALGGARNLDVDVCVSFTGNAGPTSDQEKRKLATSLWRWLLATAESFISPFTSREIAIPSASRQ